MNHSTGTADTLNLIMGWVLIGAIPLLVISALIGIRSRVAAWASVIFGVALQTFHTVEHIVQVIYWEKNPWAAPYMSALAKKAASGLESIATGVFGVTVRPTLGMELLHLVGNSLFLAGIAALVIGLPFKNRHSAAVIAFTFEGLHLAEHALLTVNVVAGRPAWGSSTLFNAISGSQLSTHRIWWHLIMNLAALILFIWALKTPKITTRLKYGAAAMLASVNFLPVLMAHLFGSPMSGYASTSQLFSVQTIFSLLINPVTITAAVLLLWATSDRSKSKEIKLSNQQ